MNSKPKHTKRHRKVKIINFYSVLFLICCVLLVVSIRLNIKTAEFLKEVNERQLQLEDELSEIKKFDDPLIENQDLANKTSEFVDYESAKYLANVAWGEARGCSVTEQAAVMWCVLNRVDSPVFPDSVKEVVTQPNQFDGYSENNPITSSLLGLANDVMTYWDSKDDSGRVLPGEYLYFLGDGSHNYFYTTWGDTSNPYNWTLQSPYEGADTE